MKTIWDGNYIEINWEWCKWFNERNNNLKLLINDSTNSWHKIWIDCRIFMKKLIITKIKTIIRCTN